MHLKDYVVIILSYKKVCLKFTSQLSSFSIINIIISIFPKTVLLDDCMYAISILIKTYIILVVGNKPMTLGVLPCHSDLEC